jgi:phosphodiesterase/alkaline phosphatase D-like protein
MAREFHVMRWEEEEEIIGEQTEMWVWGGLKTSHTMWRSLGCEG